MSAWAGTAWAGEAHAGAAVSGDAWGSSGAAPLITVTLPPFSSELSEPAMRDMGRTSHIAGHHWLLASTHYVWHNHGGAGWDPGPYEATLTGRTGIEVTHVAGNRTGPQNATDTAAAIDAVGGFGATADGANVVITGAGSASAGSRTYDFDSCGVVGMQAADLSGAIPEYANGATSAALFDNAELPAEPIMVTGFRMSVGGTHTNQVTVAVYQGGAADTDCEDAVLLGTGVMTGTAINQNVYFAADAPFVVDPTAGRVWMAWSHASGGFLAPYPLNSSSDPIHVAARDTSNWVVASGNTTREMSSITLTSDPDDWPSTLPAVTGQTVGMPPITMSYVVLSSCQNDMRVTARFGTRALAASMTGTSSFTLAVGNSFGSLNPIATLGMTVLQASVNYAVHTSGSDYRLSLGTGGAANDDMRGAEWFDIGRAGGTETGWVDVVPDPGTIAIPPNTRIWIFIHHTAGGSSLAFDALTPDAYSPSHDPAAYYNGNTSESEADDGTLLGTPSTNISFDEGVANTGVISPDGTIYTNDNNVGVRMLYEIPGFAVA